MFCPRRSKYLWLAGLLPCLAWAAMTEEEMFFKGVSEVNEGELRFLSAPPASPVHHHQNQISLNTESLLSGWAKLAQCHHHLDPVPRMQIVYNQDRIRNLAISRSENIGRSWVHENSVQMDQVARNALICITADTQALEAAGKNTFVLTNGPYMRRFLDGYYPMQVSMRVNWDIPGFHFIDITPEVQTGLVFTQKANEVGFDAIFEGELRTRIRFSATPE